MDKFTKTTEIDISAMNDMEDETPKKSNVGKIVAMIICLIASIFIWLLVMETDDTKIKKEYKDVSVVVVYDVGAQNQGYEIIPNTMDVTIEATRSDMADLSKDGITLTLYIPKDFNYDLAEQKLTVKPVICGSGEGAWKMVSSSEVTVQVIKK